MIPGKRPATLDYSSRIERRPPEPLFWISLLAGVAPLVAGVSILIGYWATDDFQYAQYGFSALFYGGLSVLVGVVLAVVYLVMSRRAIFNARRAVRRGSASLLVLFLNFPVAIFCVMSGSSLIDHARVEFHLSNAGRVQIDGGRIIFGSQVVPFGDMRPGWYWIAKARVDSKGKIRIEVKRGARVQTYELSDQIDFGSDGKRHYVTFDIYDDRAVRVD